MLMKTYPVVGSAEIPPQSVPPMSPGKLMAVRGGAPGARYAHGVYGPLLTNMPPLFSTRSRQAAAWASVVSAAVTRSSGLYECLPSMGGLIGNGCVFAVNSPGASL